jgi:thioredoxin reductase (NADPH)
VRGPGLAATMSRYLIDRIGATANIVVHPRTELTRLHGEHELTAVSWRSRETGVESEHAIGNVFLFIGADPETDWLKGCGVVLDAHGFVVTGQAARSESNASPAPLESSVPGVYAVGDVRSGSVKRVGGAIGEGAAAVAVIHQFLGPRA